MTNRYGYLITLAVPVMPVVGYLIGGWGNFLTFTLLLVLLPILDFVCGRDTSNVSNDEWQAVNEEKYYRYITFIYAFLHVALLIFSLYIVSTRQLSPLEWLGLALSVGLVTGGMGINFGHELCHKNTKFERFLSQVLLTSVCYGHFYIEHQRGHHVRVATPEDPASARPGETVYQFLPRTLKGSLMSAWNLEQERLKRKNYHAWSWHNQMLWFLGIPVVLVLFLFDVGGLFPVLFFLVQSTVAFSLLEIINYVEHYGLQRQKNPNGEYERVDIRHSWNNNNRLSNWLLIQLQRHSDHHTHTVRRYQVLRDQSESPQLPTGYPGMLWLALCPPLWRKVMDPKVKAYNAINSAG